MKVVGKGSYGKVMLVKHRNESNVYAMKMLRKENVIKRNQVEHTKTERNVLEAVSHPFIVTLHYAFQTPKKLYFVLEYCPGGELFFHLSRAGRFSEGRCRFYASEILLAIEYLHRLNIIYRDLKPENILLTNNMEDEDNDIKVADFGLAVDLHFDGYHPEESMRLKESKDIEGGFCGSPIAMAPEVAMKGAKYGPQVDIWSLGCMTYELLDGKPPFVAKNARALFKLVKESPGPDFCRGAWKNISKDAKDITGQMLQKLPQNRPSAREALQHQWFKAAPDRHLEDAHSTIVSRRTTARGEDYEEDEVDKTLEGTHTAAKLVGGTKAP
mmetsp:Transcript_23846/g.38083  ORF Transcript_23846/g.38083 Transcript_23846/m.38083 type:complete len:327 (+) Transcript_23846:2-982(+)